MCLALLFPSGSEAGCLKSKQRSDPLDQLGLVVSFLERFPMSQVFISTNQNSVSDSHFKLMQKFAFLQKKILVSQVLNKHIATPYLLRLFPLEVFWQ